MTARACVTSRSLTFGSERRVLPRRRCVLIPRASEVPKVAIYPTAKLCIAKALKFVPKQAGGVPGSTQGGPASASASNIGAALDFGDESDDDDDDKVDDDDDEMRISEAIQCNAIVASDWERWIVTHDIVHHGRQHGEARSHGVPVRGKVTV